MSDSFALAAPWIFDGEFWLRDAVLMVRDGLVEAVMERYQTPYATQITESGAGMLAPKVRSVNCHSRRPASRKNAGSPFLCHSGMTSPLTRLGSITGMPDHRRRTTPLRDHNPV